MPMPPETKDEDESDEPNIVEASASLESTSDMAGD